MDVDQATDRAAVVATLIESYVKQVFISDMTQHIFMNEDLNRLLLASIL